MAIPSIQDSRRQRSDAARRRVRRRRLAAALVGLLVLLVLLLTFAGPPLLRRQLQQRLPEELQRDVLVGPIQINPLTLSLTSRDSRVLDRDGQVLAGWQRLHVNLQVSSLWKRGWVFRRIEVDDPAGRLLVQPDGSLNISDLLERYGAEEKPAEEPRRPRAVQVHSLVVTGARFHFEDHSREQPFVTTLGPISFTLTRFATAGDDAAPYRFSAVSEAGETLEWQGDFGVAPLRSTGSFAIGGLQLPKYATYLPAAFRGEIRDGELSLSGHYEASLSGAEPQVSIADGKVQLKNLQLAQPDEEAPLLALPAVDVHTLAGTLAPLRLTIGQADIRGGAIAVHREANGTLDLLNLWQGSQTQASVAPAPDLAIDNLTVHDFAFAWRDDALPRPAELEGTLVALTGKAIRLPGDQPSTWSAEVQLGTDARLTARGEARLEPLSIGFETTVEAVPLSWLSPYIEPMLNVRVAQGSLTADGQLRFAAAAAPNAAPTFQWSGLVGVSNFAAVTLAEDPLPVAGFEQLALREVTWQQDAAQRALTIQEVELSGAQAELFRNADGSINLGAIAPEAEPAVEEAPPSADAPLSITIHRTLLRDGAVRFEDRAVEPAVRVAMDQLQAEVGLLSTERRDHAEATIRGRIEENGRVAIAARLNPLNPEVATELTVEVQGVDLQPAAPYIAKYAGHELEQGQLQLDLDYTIASGQLRSENRVLLDHFTLGEASGSPDATGLPVKLAIALLKDRQGRIVVDVPIEGNLDDPSFRLGRVISRAIVNLLTRAATSPFSLLAGLIPGAGEKDPSQLEFAPGAVALEPAQQALAEGVARALSERPALTVAIVGSFDPALDRAHLQRAAFEQTFRQRLWDQQRSQSDPAAPPPEFDAASVPSDARERALRRWHHERSGQPLVLTAEQMAAIQAQIQEEPEQAAPTSRSGSGFWRRFWQSFGLSEPAAETVEPAAEDPAVLAERQRQLDLTLQVVGPDLVTIEEELVTSMEIDEVELTQMAEQRAREVQSALLAAGVEPERVLLGKTEATGTYAKLQLR